MASAPPDVVGVAVPADHHGRRSTSAFAKTVLSEAIGNADPAAAAAVREQADWRANYHRHFVAAAEAGISSPANARQIAERGLDTVHDLVRFVRDDRDEPLSQVLRGRATGRPFDTKVVAATAGSAPQYTVPYKGLNLRGADLRRQLETWVGSGVIEVSAASAVEEVLDSPDWLDLSDITVVVMGAGAELGPYPALMGLGATVAAVDLPLPEVWKRLSARSGQRSRLLYPSRQGVPGADLCVDLPEVRDWINTIEGPLVLGGYAYADGEAHLRVSVAQDAIIADAIARRPAGHVSVAHLLTPTDAYAVSEATAEASRRAWEERPLPLRAVQGTLRKLSGDRLFEAAITDWIDGKDGYRAAVFDTLVSQQGPNYALAKRIQEWRAVSARANGMRVSANVSPSSTTRSVTKNKALAAAYRGAGMFNIEVFQPNTTNALMALLLIRDLRTVTGPADPHAELTNPLQLFSDAACHGGLWRSPYKTRTALPLAAVKGMFTRSG
ncbi:MAG: hypothetical protein HKN03_02530 [Acidimicrobiales bacterium]|nr:hypothetical protein [Acidimicrobiales bacterium]